ncbi:amidohydrolase family protein [Aquihabitans sp. G128]|uniref:N-acetylglucosamine-6-phosphate deacetylase n=1 Tax=Aquihabitans sp. G128 TaxID=2849779 RepID=UPI001C2219D5|nr:amidohydrolase family protein [Aquihabitans sp. G128]QXC62053.1 amidohydrolase family protein [Aquihabitans sp. G128]
MPAITARQVVLPDRIAADAAVEVDDRGHVVEVRPAAGPVDHEVLVPGLVDLQVNGHDDVDVASARGEGWDRLDDLLLAQGVTAWCPTLVTAPLDAFARPLARIGEASARPGRHPEVLGAHLEGPFLGGKPGAHPTELIRAVDPAWLEALPAHVALVTAAAECEGVDALWAWATERGVLASVGHSAASAEAASAAFDRGARMVTHLFNGMSGVDHRSPGVAVAALLDDRVAAGLIADGVHVHPDLVRLAFRVKGPGRIALVTDAVAWRAGTIGRITMHHDGTAPRLADGTLAGSALTLDRAVANVVAWGATDLVGAVRAAATTPADLLGRSDLGRIAPGARADLAALDADGACVGTWLAGTRVR